MAQDALISGDALSATSNPSNASTNSQSASRRQSFDVTKGEIHHQLDPKGDTILILQSPNAPFAIWVEGSGWPDVLCQRTKQPGTPSECVTGVDGPGADDNPTVASLRDGQEHEKSLGGDIAECDHQVPRDSDNIPVDGRSDKLFRVSSRHLILASDYFAKMLEGPWKESEAATFSCPRIIHAEGWDEAMLLVLMNIIHGRSRAVPRELDLESIAKLAVLVDYYQCLEAVEMHAAAWLQRLPSSISKQFGRDQVLSLLVAWVFPQKELLNDACRSIVRQSRGPIQSLNLPISELLVGKSIAQIQEERSGN